MDTRLVHVEVGVELRVIFGDLGFSSGVLRRPRAVPSPCSKVSELCCGVFVSTFNARPIFWTLFFVLIRTAQPRDF